MPRLRASRHHAVPLHEHSGPLLHRLSRRRGYGAALSAREISPRGSRPISAGAGTSFDPRNNVPRIGRILMARGRDATDVAMVTSFGPCRLANFKVFSDEVAETALTA